MFTAPDDLPGTVLAGTLQRHWGFTAVSVDYQPVGFGSHHWLATDRAGARLFVTVDDLAARRRTAQDTADGAFDRLRRAFGTALALREEAGLDFVVAPQPAATGPSGSAPAGSGPAVVRLSGRYSLVAHAYVAGPAAGQDGEFTHEGHRKDVTDLLIRLHGAHAGRPGTDDFVVPHLGTLQSMARHDGGAWCSGPYAPPAQELLRTHATAVLTLVAEYQRLAGRAAAQPERMVITHGEPHAGNVIVTADGLALIDWDTVLLAPPERDLWDLSGEEPALLEHYAAATGTAIDNETLLMYRLRFDLAEVAEYLSLFRAPHKDTADTRESWKNLQHHLRPAERWPSLVHRSR